MEPISTIGAAANIASKVYASAKFAENVIVNDGVPSQILPYTLIYAASHGIAAACDNSLAPAVSPSEEFDTVFTPEVKKYLEETEQDIMAGGSVNIIDDGNIEASFRTVDKDYVNYGHVRDVCTAIKNGELPSARQFYLALLDIIDAIDMGLAGSSITTARLKDHIHKQKVVLRTRIANTDKIIQPTEISNGASITRRGQTINTTVVTETTTIKTDSSSEEQLGQRVTTVVNKTEEEARIIEQPEIASETKEKVSTAQERKEEKKTVHELSVYVSENNGSPKLIVCRRATALGENVVDTLEEVEKRGRWDGFKGSSVATATTTTSKGKLTQTLEELDSESGRMILVGRYEENAPTIIEKGVQNNWESGWVTYIPMGSVVDLIGKKCAGFAVSAADIGGAALDIGLTVATFGAGSAVSSTMRLGGTAVLHAAGKSSAKALASTASRATISGTKAAEKLGKRFEHIGEVFSEPRIHAGNLAKVHNPMKNDFCKSMAKLARLDEGGANIRDYLEKEFLSQGKMGAYRANWLEKQYRGLRQHKLLTPENRQLLSQGRSPFNAAGERLDLDHIVPQSLEKSLKAEPANLTFLGHAKNISKSNHFIKGSMEKLKNICKANPEWIPSDQLRKAMQVFIHNNPNYDASWAGKLI